MIARNYLVALIAALLSRTMTIPASAGGNLGIND
jgi:hypothetical protein